MKFLIPFLFFVPSENHYEVPLPAVVPVTAVVTAYTSSPEETDDTPNVNAAGKETRSGTAACPAKYAFGTVIEIEGEKFVCEDRMHLRYRHGDFYDIWMESREEALKWGRRVLQVLVHQHD